MARGATKAERSCIGCRAKAEKQRLHRIVRTAEGRAAFDPTGRAPGRGAYVCSAACLAQACERRLLERALRCRVTDDDYAAVAEGLAAAMRDMRETEE